MNDMLIKDAIALKHKLQDQITSLMRDFETVTGLEIDGYHLERVQSLGSRPKVAYIELVVKL